MLGALRDATFDVRKSKNYEFKIAQKNRQWLLFMKQLFEKNFDVSGRISKHVNETNILRINNKTFVQNLLRLSEMKIPQENWNTPRIIKSQNNELHLHYLRGFFDAEGGMPKDPKNAKQKYISFSQKNRNSLEFIRKILIRNNFRPTNITFCGGIWEFRITRKHDMIRFADFVGSSHEDKIERLRQLKSGLFSPIWRGSTQEVEAAV